MSSDSNSDLQLSVREDFILMRLKSFHLYLAFEPPVVSCNRENHGYRTNEKKREHSLNYWEHFIPKRKQNEYLTTILITFWQNDLNRGIQNNISNIG